MIIINFLKSYAPSPFIEILRWVRGLIVDQYAIKSYSQEGEDMILRRIFEGQKNGFYIDVGAHHPRLFSNTYFFYKQGWTGVNIEPNPHALRGFQSDRPRDLNLNLGISDTNSVLTYYYFDEPALNTFDKGVVKSRLTNTSYKVIKAEDVTVERLDHVLKKYFPIGVAIDFLSVDVEGLDLAVLRSNDWQLFRPRYVLAEALNLTLDEAMQGDVVLFMVTQGYALFGRTYNTLIFCDKTT